MAWISFTLFAALMQSVRTAGQKQMTNQLSALVTSWARYGFGFPVALVYLLAVYFYYQPDTMQFSVRFWLYVSIASVAQLIATILLVKVLSQRNFASATTYAKTEGLLSAILALALFQSSLSILAWVAIAVGFVGIFFVSLQKTQISPKAGSHGYSVLMGLTAGLCFAVTAVFVRQANIQMNAPTVLSAAIVLLTSIAIQGTLCSVLVHRQNPNNWRQLKAHMKPGWFVGITGSLGSIGWYTAFALKDAAIVKTLGQVEFIFTLLLTYLFFRERVQRYEWIGITLVILSILLLVGSQ